MITENFSNPEGADLRHDSTYYPLFLDIAALTARSEIKPKPEPDVSQKVYNAEELMEIAIQHDCSEFQTLILLLKNAFEGHVFLSFGLSSAVLFEKGALHFNPVNDTHCEFSLHFIDHLDSYRAGLKRVWQELRVIFPTLNDICFDSMMCLILASQLYKLPVTALGSIDISRFRNPTDNGKRFFQYFFEISMIAQRAIADMMKIDYVNEIYMERFREYVLKLSAKENLLFQLETKLIYAIDPRIRTEEQLEKKYFSFLITNEIQKDSGNLRLKYSAWDDENGSGENPSGLKADIRHLFRAISKNCREAFTAADKTEQTVDSTRFFMKSNSIYNEMSYDFNDQFLQYNQLINLFVQVFNTRIIHELPATFFDYSGIDQDKMLYKMLNDEIVQKMKISVLEKISDLKERCRTTFKGKHVADKELAEIHNEYLKMQIQFLDQRISEILAEIKKIMKQKSVASVV